MVFNCQYIPDFNKSTSNVSYYRTVYADGINEAVKQAKKYARKNYILLKVIQQF